MSLETFDELIINETEQDLSYMSDSDDLFQLLLEDESVYVQVYVVGSSTRLYGMGGSVYKSIGKPDNLPLDENESVELDYELEELSQDEFNEFIESFYGTVAPLVIKDRGERVAREIRSITINTVMDDVTIGE